MASGAPGVAFPTMPAEHVTATPALRADVERLASQLDDWGRRYLTRDWKPALEELRAALGEVEATFERLAALSDPAELLSVAAPLGATGFGWAVELDDLVNNIAFRKMAGALACATAFCPALPETVRASCDFVAGLGLSGGRQLDMARTSLERALVVRTRLLGPADGSTLEAAHALAVCHFFNKAFPEAQALFKAAYDGRKQLLGESHPTTLQSLQRFAEGLTLQGKVAAAEALQRVALSGLEAALGPDHPRTIFSATGLGICFRIRGDFGPALALLQKSAERLARTRGVAHPTTLNTLLTASTCLNHQRQHAEALAVQQPALETAMTALGDDHDTTLLLVIATAISLGELGRFQEALALAQPALPRMLATLGPFHPDVQRMPKYFITWSSRLQAGSGAAALGRGRGRGRGRR
jgi:tetratricopeptide (TPR) repeat protein